MAASPSSGGGDYSASPLLPSGSWSAGNNSGSFEWSYPIAVPPALGGSAPNVALAYDSGSIDGRTSSTNAQASWVGDGWDYSPGFIERSYKPCSSDGNPASGDDCWAGQNITISFGSISAALVHDDNGNGWHLSTDDGSKLELLTGAANGDGGPATGDGAAGEYWRLTQKDGTAYYFGLNHLPGGDGSDPATGSTWSVPVFGNQPGEPCYVGTDFNANWCQQAWRWNLDYVVDPHGNLTTYSYTSPAGSAQVSPEVNAYTRGTGTSAAVTSYTRGGTLQSISYGTRLADQLATSPQGGVSPAAQITFTSSQRCLTTSTVTCDPSQLSANASSWPDVPADQICSPSASTCPNHTPTFFSQLRLTGIDTRVLKGSTYSPVDSYALTQTFPDPGDGTSPSLFLSTIARTGVDGTSTSLPTPLTFAPKSFPNRVDGGPVGAPQFNRQRINQIVTETGEQISVSYAAGSPAQPNNPECSRLNSRMPASPDSNTMACYPVYWTPANQTSPQLDWFNKYLVTQVSETDLTSAASPAKVTSYTYLGGAAWHRDDSDQTNDAQRTWNEFRGYAEVVTSLGHGSETSPVTETDTWYLRGMNGDLNAQSVAKAVSVTGARAPSITDDNWLRGRVRETDTRAGAGGSIVHATWTDPYASAVTATHARSTSGGTLPALTARFVGDATAHADDLLASGAWRTSTKTYSYDSHGLVTALDDLGDGASSTTAPERCTQTSYASNPAAGMYDYPATVTTFTGPCTGSPTASNTVAASQTLYDSATSPGQGLTVGDATTTQAIDHFTSGVPQFVTTASGTYDRYGRQLTSVDGKGNTTTTTFTPTGGALPTSVAVKNALGWVTTTTYDPGRRQPLTTTDPNGRVTTVQYDGLGRVSAVWLPTQNGKATPNISYTYTIPGNTTPPSVTTATLLDNGVDTGLDVKIYDGLLRIRQEQASPTNGSTGRVITDSFYDSHGYTVKSNNPYFNNTGATTPVSTLWVATDKQVDGQNAQIYDGLGRVTAQTYSSLGVERWRTTTAYPGLDRTDVTPPAGGTATSTITDSRGDKTALWRYTTTTPTGNAAQAKITTYAYDAAQHLTGVTDPGGDTWTYHYDYQGRETSSNDPDAGSSTSTYDAAGNLATSTTPAGTLAYSYDTLNRKTGVYNNSVSTANALANWTYDGITTALGYLSSSVRHDGGSDYTTSIDGYTTGYKTTGTTITIPSAEGGLAGTFDTKSFHTTVTERTDHVTYPAVGGLPAENVYYGYDKYNLLQNAGGNYPYFQGTSYSTFGEVMHTNFGAGSNVAYDLTYDAGTRRMVSSSLSHTGWSAAADSSTYSYNANGDTTAVKDVRTATSTGAQATDTQCFQYDQLNQLNQAWSDTAGTTTPTGIAGLGRCTTTAPTSGTGTTVGGPAAYWLSWSDDALGNRTQQVDHLAPNSQTTTYTYPTPGNGVVGPHQMGASLTKNGTGATVGSSSFTFDTSGRTKTRPGVGGGTQALTYGVEGHLTSLTQTGGTAAGTTTYTYDADGNLLLRRNPGQRTLFLGDQDITLNTSTQALSGTRYYAGPNSTVTRGSDGTISFLFTDPHGTATETFSTTGVLTRRDVTPYGTTRGTTPGSWPNARGFLGAPLDATSGLTTLGARNYDPTIGVFTTPDPLIAPSDPRTQSAYQYAGNNPVGNSDPSGLQYMKEGDDNSDSASTSSSAQASPASGASSPPSATSQFVEGAAAGGGEAIRQTISSLTPSTIINGIDNLIHHFSFSTFFGGLINGLTHLDDFEGAFNAFKNGDAYNAGFYTGKLITEIGIDLLTTILGAKAATAAAAAIRGARAAKAAAAAVDAVDAGAVDAGAANAAQEEAAGDAANACYRGGSFTPKTEVVMEDGSRRPLDQIKAGDRVQATDPTTGKTAPELVTAVWVNHDVDLMDVNVTDGVTRTVIHGTQKHLFWDQTVGFWVQENSLKPGDVLRTGAARVTVVSTVAVAGAADMWDLTVSGSHDFYVGTSAFSVLVHNEGGGGASGTVFRDGKYVFQIYAGDHGPPHGHLKGEGYDIQLGQNGKPVNPDVDLTAGQRQVVDRNLGAIRSSVGAKMAEYRANGC